MAKKKIGAPEEKTESRPKAVRPSAARKKPAAKKQKKNSPKGKYAEESTDHSSDYSTEDEDTVYEYTVVEYGGRRAQLIMGWRKAIMGPAPAASIDEASIDEACIGCRLVRCDHQNHFLPPFLFNEDNEYTKT